MSDAPSTKETPDQKLDRLEAQYSDVTKVIAELSTKNVELSGKLDASAAILQKVVDYLQKTTAAQPGAGPQAAAQPAAPGMKIDASAVGPFVDIAKQVLQLIIEAKTGFSGAAKADPLDEMIMAKARKNAMKNLAVRSSLSESDIDKLIKTGKLNEETIELLKQIDSR